MNKRKIIISIALNSVILAITILGMGLGVLDVVGKSYGELFKYFTVLSNLFLFISAAISITYESLYLNLRIKKIPTWVNIVKLSATCSTTITFLVVLFFLFPLTIVKSGAAAGFWLFWGSGFCFHLFNPILGIIIFILFEDAKEIKLPELCYGLIFVVIYGVFYIANYYANPVEAQDWYHFLSAGVFMVPIIIILFVGISFLVTWLLWLANRKIHLWEKAA
ncbi:MAG: hypothetical protein ACOQNY_01270 [Mycoplasmoidaceae bacterium]